MFAIRLFTRTRPPSADRTDRIADRSREATASRRASLGIAAGGSPARRKSGSPSTGIGNIYRVPALRDAFPNARFVALVRDGRAVALSLSRVDWWPTSTVVGYGGTPDRWAAEGGDPWELCARNWVDELTAMEQGLEGVADAQLLRLRYEDLIAEPLAQLDAIATFAGLSPRASWHGAVGRVRFPDRNDAWRERLDADALATIEAVQTPTLERYGYGG